VVNHFPQWSCIQQYAGIQLPVAKAGDQLDYTANGDNLGKTLGQDLMQGMITLPLLHLLQACSYEERQELVGKIESKTIEESDLPQIRSMMEQYGSLQYTTTRSQEYSDAALLTLDSFEDSPAKRALTVVADYMVNRDR